MNCNVLSLKYWANYYTTNICNTSQLGSNFFTKLQKVITIQKNLKHLNANFHIY